MFTSPPILIAIIIVTFVSLWKTLKRSFLLKDIPLSKIRSAAQGHVEITGKAAPLDKIIKSPLSNVECCWFSYKIEVEINNDWHTLAHYESSHCFRITDGTGELIVYPTHADTSNLQEFQWIQKKLSFDHDNAHSNKLKSIFNFIAGKRYRITERRVHANENITVLGCFHTLTQNSNTKSLKLSQEHKAQLFDKISQKISSLNQLIHPKNKFIAQAKKNMEEEEKDWDLIQKINQNEPLNFVYKKNRDFIVSRLSGTSLCQKYKFRFRLLCLLFLSLMGWTTYIILSKGFFS